MMTQLDEHVGRILALLEELELDQKTLVMLTSDNGPHKEGGHRPEFFDSNGPLRGHKRDLYEGGIRAPLLARWVGKIASGARSDHISAHWDMLPTFCELAGIEVPEATDGISMVPTLLGQPEQQRPHDYLYWEFYEQGGKRAVRSRPCVASFVVLVLFVLASDVLLELGRLLLPLLALVEMLSSFFLIEDFMLCMVWYGIVIQSKRE